MHGGIRSNSSNRSLETYLFIDWQMKGEKTAQNNIEFKGLMSNAFAAKKIKACQLALYSDLKLLWGVLM